MAKIVIDPNANRHVLSSYNWLHIGLLGAALGVVTLGLAWLLGWLIIDPLLCGSADVRGCGGSTLVSGNIALLVASVLGLVALIRLHVRRPLLVVLAIVILFWNVAGLTSGLFWAEAALWMALLTGLGYLLFAWVLRWRSLALALIATIVPLIVLRLIAFM